MFEKPMGGTEIMYEELIRRLPEELKDKFSIFNYLNYADFSKPTIFWNMLSYDQNAISWLSDTENIEKINHFVFVSFWQFEKFRELFKIPSYKCSIIKNACLGVEKRDTSAKEKVKICYTSTPFRGLDILIDSWEQLKPVDCELHIFSSCKIYGQDFFESEDKKYEILYEKCKNIDGIIYRGSIPNSELRKELKDFDILAYPCTFEETCSISVIEALSAGLRVLCSSLGALPETTEGWAKIYPFYMDRNVHIKMFSKLLDEEIKNIKKGLDLNLQADIYSNNWSWDKRIKEWEKLLTL